MTPVRLEPAALRSRVKHSTTEPLRSPIDPSVNHEIDNLVLLFNKINSTIILDLENKYIFKTFIGSVSFQG